MAAEKGAMTGDGHAGAAAPPRRDRDGTSRVAARLRRAPAAPLAAVGLAIVAIAGAYLTSHANTHSKGLAPASTSPVAPSYPAPTLNGALGPVAGPDGTIWHWISQSASFELTNLKQNWVAFSALGSTRRRLEFTGPAGERSSVTLQPAPSTYLVGPLSAGRVVVSAAGRIGARGQRPSSRAALISALRATANPLAAVPGSGFWTQESSGGVVFNWMRRVASIDVYAPRATTGRAWLTFDARSLGVARTLIVRSGSAVQSVAVGIAAEPVTVGPFALVARRAHVTLTASPGPARYGTDPRTLSVQIASLGGYTAPGEA